MQISYDAKSKTVTVTFLYDEGANYPASSTGKRELVASSHGFMAIPGTTAQFSANVTRQPKGK